MATGADGKSGHAGQPERPKAGSASEVLHSAVPPKSVKPIRGDARMTAQHQGLLFASEHVGRLCPGMACQQTVYLTWELLVVWHTSACGSC